MKAFINKLLHPLGIQLVRVGKPLSVIDTPRQFVPVPNRVVEFVGPSGVGKSTLLRRFMRESGLRNSLMGPEEFDSVVRNRYTIGSQLSETHEWMLNRKLRNLAGSFHKAGVKYARLNYFRQVVAADFLMLSVPLRKPLVIEEGILHNGSKEIEQMALEKGETFREFLARRYVVFCEAPADFIASNLAKRSAGGLKGRGKERIFDERVLMHSTDAFAERALQRSLESLKSRKRLIAFLTENGVPVVTVNTADSFGVNRAKIEAFFRESRVIADQLPDHSTPVPARAGG